MHPGLLSILGESGFARGSDGCYEAPADSFGSDQGAEQALRADVAARHYEDLLGAIAQNHSIPVMDHEIDRFLAAMPHGASILDIGGCWGWHWRWLAATRPDVGVLIIDFVRANLMHARKLLGPLVDGQVALMHADATALPFADAGRASRGFDGVWTVQVFQHIPDFARACREAHRVLKPGGRFANYSLHRTPLNRTVYRLLGKRFHTDGLMPNAFHLTRANDSQRQAIADIFGGPAQEERYTECLFHPDLKLSFTARPGSALGRLDARLGGTRLARWIARQCSFEAVK